MRIAAKICESTHTTTAIEQSGTDELTDLAIEKYNNIGAEVDESGRVWTGTHWLDHDEMDEFVRWVVRQQRAEWED